MGVRCRQHSRFWWWWSCANQDVLYDLLGNTIIFCVVIRVVKFSVCKLIKLFMTATVLRFYDTFALSRQRQQGQGVRERPGRGLYWLARGADKDIEEIF